ncbi:30S ribosomal protein S17 [Patescibacteria group bacterium]|nr:30S ribosomal protein S17 [Patescibacteria group bacterium]
MRTKSGTVTSTKMDKTIVLVVHAYKTHPKYKKRYRVSKKFYAHDPEGKAAVGDEITVYETAPLSKLKRWTTEMPKTTEQPK